MSRQIHGHHGQPMFTVKPANDEEEFYAAIERDGLRRAMNDLLLYGAASLPVRNLPNLLPPTVLDVWEGGTCRVPSLPHAADVS